MAMVILTLNCGSSSAKYQVYDWDNKSVLASGVVERIGAEGSGITHKANGDKTEIKSPCPTHKEAIELILKTITDPKIGVISDMSVIKSVGHRVLHGGDKFTKSVVITPEVLETFRSVQDLGPLHNPANIMGIEAAQKVMPGVPQCAIMDTAWHQTMPEHNFMYAIPQEWYTKYSARRYGFHGTSFLYTAKRASVLLHKKHTAVKVIEMPRYSVVLKTYNPSYGCHTFVIIAVERCPRHGIAAGVSVYSLPALPVRTVVY